MKWPFRDLMHIHNYVITILDVVYRSILCDYMCARGLWVITSTVQPARLSVILLERPHRNISESKDFR